MDPEIAEFARTFTDFAKAMKSSATSSASELTEVGASVQDFLGVPLGEVEPVAESFPAHQVVDIDLALDELVERYDGRRRGINGMHRQHVDSITEFLLHPHLGFRFGALGYERQPTGPDTDRRVVALGLGEVLIDGVPLVWLQRTPQPRYGREEYALEVMSPEAETADRFLRELRETAARVSILHGQIISFAKDNFSHHAPGAALTFLPRPEVTAEEVILPAGVLDRIVRHVVGIGEHRAELRTAGQHLKRGVLLYGPPGTGKTHVVRHLLSRTAGTTAVLLSGRTLNLLHVATQLGRAAQPAIVVLEDCDLVAEHRGGDSNAALFETLEAMDGLAADADITFVLTTNRADLLERALVERPGRVDLAVEVAKPDLDGRERLFRLYAADLLATGRLTDAAVRAAAERTEGVTASFTKELIRRVVINAAQSGRPATDTDVDVALDEMLSDAEALTRTLLGGAGRPLLEGLPLPDEDDAGPDWHMSFDED